MKFTGNTEFMLGRKLYEREDGFYQDISGNVYDIRDGKLYREDGPEKWTWIRPPQPTVGDTLLRDAEAIK